MQSVLRYVVWIVVAAVPLGTANAQQGYEFGFRFRPITFRPQNFRGFSHRGHTFRPLIAQPIQFGTMTFPPLNPPPIRLQEQTRRSESAANGRSLALRTRDEFRNLSGDRDASTKQVPGSGRPSETSAGRSHLMLARQGPRRPFEAINRNHNRPEAEMTAPSRQTVAPTRYATRFNPFVSDQRLSTSTAQHDQPPSTNHRVTARLSADAFTASRQR